MEVKAPARLEEGESRLVLVPVNTTTMTVWMPEMQSCVWGMVQTKEMSRQSSRTVERASDGPLGLPWARGELDVEEHAIMKGGPELWTPFFRSHQS